MPNRFVVWGILFILVIPFSWLVTSWLKKPVLYPGDRLEQRTCRQCGGAGVEAADDGPIRAGSACIGCRGKKQVAVILPGPEHPSLVKGAVFSGTGGEFRDPGQPVPGAIPQARIVFEKGDQKVELTSNLKGRFRARLSPGEWKVTANADGFKTSTGVFQVPLRTEPIYQEEANIIGPDEVGELDHLGLPCDIPMSR